MEQNFIKKLAHDSHKYSHGTVAVFAGSRAYAGAAQLCVGGTRRGGAGFVNFVSKDSQIRNIVLSAYPDIVVHRNFKNINVDAVVMGSGSLKLPTFRKIPKAHYVVLDSVAMKLAQKVSADFVVITPHVGEAKELGFAIGDGDKGRQESALQIARAFNCVVVLKGFHTVVAEPNGMVMVDTLAGPELATAGTGDILAGLIGSMLASWKPSSFKEVVVVVFKAVSAHALAAKAAAQELTPITSLDILKYLPTILRQ